MPALTRRGKLQAEHRRRLARRPAAHLPHLHNGHIGDASRCQVIGRAQPITPAPITTTSAVVFIFLLDLLCTSRSQLSPCTSKLP